jgi:hypothetical protein
MKTKKNKEEEERKVMQSRQNESFPPENLAHFLSFSHLFALLHKQTSHLKELQSHKPAILPNFFP